MVAWLILTMPVVGSELSVLVDQTNDSPAARPGNAAWRIVQSAREPEPAKARMLPTSVVEE